MGFYLKDTQKTIKGTLLYKIIILFMRIKRLPVLIYTTYAALVFTIFMLLYIPLIITPLLFKHEDNRLSFLGVRLWAICFRWFSGIRYKVRGQDHLQANHPYIFTLNHTSYLDIPAIPLIAHHSFKALAKQEIARIPIFGFVARAVVVMVNRSNAANRRRSIATLTQALQAGTNLLVFPEGTINKTAEPLAHFYEGAFQIALETQTPIVPVVICGASHLMPPGQFGMKPGTIQVQILPPVPVEEFSAENIQSLKELVFEKMQQAVVDLQNERKAKSLKKDTASAVPL